MFGLSPVELLIVGMIALMLFGKRLPEVARGLGKGIVEFKKGMAGVEDEVRNASRPAPAIPAARPVVQDDEQKWDAPQLEPPKSEPVKETTV